MKREKEKEKERKKEKDVIKEDEKNINTIHDKKENQNN